MKYLFRKGITGQTMPGYISLKNTVMRYARAATLDAITLVTCGTALRIDSSSPARKVIALIGQLWQDPCNSSITVMSSVSSTNLTSPPSA